MMRASVLLLTLVLLGLLFTAAEGAPRMQSGAPAPQLAGYDLAGQAHNLSDYRGRWVFVDFWATWCNPCMRALPRVVALQQQLKDRSDFTVLGVSLDNGDRRDAVQGTASRYGVSYPVLYDEGGNSAAARGWNVNAIPATFLVDPQGNVVASDVEPEQVQSIIEKYAPRSAPKLSPAPHVPPPADAKKPQQRQPAAQDTPKAKPIKSVAQLLSNSPSCGRSDRRDLILTINSRKAALGAGLYLLHVQAATQDPQGQAIKADARFEVLIGYQEKDPSAPYTLEIRPAAGSGISQGILLLSDISAELDAANHLCHLIVPVPSRSSSISYELMPFDRGRGEYLHTDPVPVGL